MSLWEKRLIKNRIKECEIIKTATEAMDLINPTAYNDFSILSSRQPPKVI